MKLDMQQFYIDRRLRTANSKSESDFSVELPRSFNVPDGVIAHIDDIVLPVSWSTILLILRFLVWEPSRNIPFILIPEIILARCFHPCSRLT